MGSLAKRYNEAVWLGARLWNGLGHLRARGPENGQPCLVLPGFMTSDRSALQLRKALAKQGFRVYGWNLGINLGADIFHLIEQRLNEIYDGRKLLVVGWSLGGLFARELARAHPDKIEAVVTLGSPIEGDLRNNNVWRCYEVVAGHRVDQAPVNRIVEKPPVLTLAIWSPKDGLIPEEAARGSEKSRDFEFMLPCTHMAFGISSKWTEAVAIVINQFWNMKCFYTT